MGRLANRLPRSKPRTDTQGMTVDSGTQSTTSTAEAIIKMMVSSKRCGNQPSAGRSCRQPQLITSYSISFHEDHEWHLFGVVTESYLGQIGRAAKTASCTRRRSVSVRSVRDFMSFILVLGSPSERASCSNYLSRTGNFEFPEPSPFILFGRNANISLVDDMTTEAKALYGAL